MCCDLIAAHKVERMSKYVRHKVESMCGTTLKVCAAQRTGMRHLEHTGTSSSGGEWAGSRSQHFTHFSTRNFWLHQQASLPVDYLEQSRCGGGGLSVLGGEQIFEGFGIQSLDPRKPEAAAATGSSQHFTHFSSRNFWLPPSSVTAWVIWSIWNREGSGRNFISSCSSMRPEQEQAFNSSGVNILTQTLDSLTWDLWCGFSQKWAITFLNTFQYFSAQTFWAKKFLAFCCDPLSRDLRGRARVDYLDEKRVILGGSIRVLTCRTI